MKLVGYNDLQARSAYQPTIHHQGDRWIAYIGHHGGTDAVPEPINPLTGKAEPNGTSIVDVTDPAHPKYLRHIPGQDGNLRGRRRADGARLRRQGAAQGRSATRSTCCARSAARRMRSGMSPIPPIPCWSRGSAGLKDTHKSWWECDTGIAFLVSGAPGWRTRRMTAGLRPQRSRTSGENPRLRPSRPGAGRDRRGADRSARADLARPARQPRLFRLRHRQGRLAADRRSRQADQRAEGADAGKPALSGNLAARRCPPSTAPTPRFR